MIFKFSLKSKLGLVYESYQLLLVALKFTSKLDRIRICRLHIFICVFADLRSHELNFIAFFELFISSFYSARAQLIEDENRKREQHSGFLEHEEGDRRSDDEVDEWEKQQILKAVGRNTVCFTRSS